MARNGSEKTGAALTLDEPLRQIAAGVLASLAFLLFYFGLSLVLWAAALLALPIYGGALIAIGRRPPPEQRYLAEGVSEAELGAALQVIGEAARRLERLDDDAPARERGVLGNMARLVGRIGDHHRRDPRDLRHTRRFVKHDLPRMVDAAERYVDLANRAGPDAADRLDELGKLIAGFTPTLEKIDRACLENDFVALEVEAEVLSEQLSRR